MRKVNLISIGAALVVFASVATALRFGSLPLGIGEFAVILVFMWALFYRQSLRQLTHPIMLFWMGFIAIAGVAALVSPIVGTASIHTGIAYVYAASFSLMALACIERATKEELISFLRAMGIIPIVLLFVPFMFFLTDSYEIAEFFGINSYYSARLSAWSSNPNQLALLLLPIPIWFLAICRDSNWQGSRWFRNFMLVWLIFFMGFSVRSDALLLAWIVGLPLLAFIASRWQKKTNWKLYGTMLLALVLAFGSFKFMIDGPGREKLVQAETALINAVNAMLTPEGQVPPKRIKHSSSSRSDSLLGVGLDENKGGVRKTLWIHATEAWLQSPFIGHGPGAFSYLEDPEKKEEAHNLAFDMLTQVGIAGVLLFAALYLWLLIKAYQARDPYSFAVLVALMLFSGAHFMLRQPVFSLYMIVCALAVKKGIFTAEREKPQPI